MEPTDEVEEMVFAMIDLLNVIPRVPKPMKVFSVSQIGLLYYWESMELLGWKWKESKK